MAIYTLTGGEVQAGSALDNSQSDTFQVGGADNVVQSIGGNLKVIGRSFAGSGLDTDTTVLLGTNTTSPKAADDVTVSITLDNDKNIVATSLSAPPLVPVGYTDSSITVTATAGPATGDNFGPVRK